ncbi:PIN domain-containing protein [Candidatus Symbiopectobacterium sp. NZEC127]|uniref:PIN domain-containing protein n=1 Tax=Candidatus Symbiopectobacterium sp. NZEC127 TaxID=2820472 RepID=UPI0022272B45|nr:PIN domain-containing protein [Candidatus Symbiopectobacterium sp. NZEC127]MCW2488037.1 PIN domain-containing protein [Candidatus Symbiopectobacterium sp. NZEC127]
MIILISDANIIIDMEEGGLINLLFSLPHSFKVPDILYYDELEEQHEVLLERGLILGELTAETLIYALRLSEIANGPSRNDCFALCLAKQEQCPLLTGDKALRELAQTEGIEVKGTLWVVEEMIHHGLITIDAAEQAYIQMRNSGRRLPWDIAFRRLEELDL